MKIIRRQLNRENRKLELALEKVKQEVEDFRKGANSIVQNLKIKIIPELCVADQGEYFSILSTESKSKIVESSISGKFETCRDYLKVAEIPEIWKVIQDKEKSKLDSKKLFSQTCEFFNRKGKRRPAVLVLTSKFRDFGNLRTSLVFVRLAEIEIGSLFEFSTCAENLYFSEQFRGFVIRAKKF